MTGGTRRAALLPVAFFTRDVALVARELLGQFLVVDRPGGTLMGRIVETEAYLGGQDPASHAFGYRRTARNAAIYGAAGSWYVYRSHGLHWCANLVAGPPGEGAAVLLRAVEPLAGLTLMHRRRGVTDPTLLCAGPGRLCQALGIDRGLDGLAMWRSPVRVLPAPPLRLESVVVTPRIGISRAVDWPLRFVVADSRWASRRAPRMQRGAG